MIEIPANWETKRLVLRPAEVADAATLFKSYTSNPDVSRYMTWRPHNNLQETVAYLQRCVEVWEKKRAFPWTLWLKEDHSFAGMLECRVLNHAADLGYVLAPYLWRRGLMSEAVSGLISMVLKDPDIHRVWAVCDVDNVASARLLENVGMELEGKLRRWIVHPNISKEPRDCFCYSVIKQAV